MLILTRGVRCSQPEVIQAFQNLFVAFLRRTHVGSIINGHVLLIRRWWRNKRMVNSVPSLEFIVHIWRIKGIFEKVSLTELRMILPLSWREVEIIWWCVMSLDIEWQCSSRRWRLWWMMVMNLLLHCPLFNVIGEFCRRHSENKVVSKCSNTSVCWTTK